LSLATATATPGTTATATPAAAKPAATKPANSPPGRTQQYSDESEEEWDDDPPPKAAAKPTPAAAKPAAAKQAPAEVAPAPVKETIQLRPGDKVVNINSFEDVDCKLLQDIEKLVKMVVPKINDAQAKRAGFKYVSGVIDGLQGKLETKDAEQLLNLLKESQKARKKADIEDKKKKAVEEEQAAKKALGKQEVDDADFFADMM
jgi:hypothetical protein